MMMSKKAQLAVLQQLVIGLVVIGMVIVIGLLVMGEAKTQVEGLGYNSAAHAVWNGTNDAIEATGDVSGWLSIVVVATVGAALLGIIMFFRGRT